MEKNFHDQFTHSDIKRYEKIRKLTIAQGENYTTECLLDYDYIKNYYTLGRQKEIDAIQKQLSK